MFLSLDMTYAPSPSTVTHVFTLRRALSCSSASDASNLANWVNSMSSNSAQFTYNGKAFLSTFAGESCTFGAGSVEQGWQNFKNQLNNVFFVPSFFIDPSTFSSYSSVIDGMFSVSPAVS